MDFSLLIQHSFYSEVLLPIVLFWLVASYTPGPNNFILLRSGANYGYVKTLPLILSISLSAALIILILGSGLAQFLTSSEFLQTSLKYIGLVYLIYLAGKIAQTKVNTSEKNQEPDIGFWQMFWFQWLNIKNLMTIINMIVVYTSTQYDFFTQVVIISLLNFPMVFISGSFWAILGTQIQRFLKNEQHNRWFNYSMAILLVASIILVF